MVDTKRAMGRMIVAGMLLGTLGAFVAEAGLDSLSATFYRCAIGGAVLAAYCLWARIPVSLPAGVGPWALSLASGALMTGNWVFFFEAMARCGIAVATLAFHVQPILVLLIGAVVAGTRLTARDVVWTLAAFAGLASTLVEKAAEPSLDAAYWLGIGAALVAAFSYAGVTLIARSLGAVPPAVVALSQCVVGAVLLSGFGPVSPGALTTAQWGWLAGLGAIHTGLVYVLIYSALPKLSTATTAVLLFIYPASAVVVDWLVYARALTLLQTAGLGLVLLAAWGAVRRS